ncbi:MAG: DUF2085 domain-containing protein [Anaerolineae bacterium]|nr:MAG: DUF2085 domain-containing protein [Anaerolineae bacterium]
MNPDTEEVLAEVRRRMAEKEAAPPQALPPAARLGYRLNRNWVWVFVAIYGVWVWLPFLAPLFMHWGWEGAARLLYGIYSFFCHQLPERSLFFFGPKRMYSLAEIQNAWQATNNPMILRQFIGNPQMGWKVAWSDRMISAYGGLWLFGLSWGVWQRLTGKAPRFRWWMAALLALPMALDGGTHFISDFAGIGQGFRYTNDWLAALTNHAFPASFYVGDALGSFNSWMRWLTGFLFSWGLAWWIFPLLDESFQASARLILRRARYTATAPHPGD